MKRKPRLLLFIAMIACAVGQTASQGSGSITGVVIESREDENKQQTLLLTVEGKENAEADEVKLKVPKKLAAAAKQGFSPEGWALKASGNFISLTGSSTRVPLYFRLDLGDYRLPRNLDVEVLNDGKSAFRDKKATVKERPPVTKSSDFTSIVKFPPVISPGDWVFLKPLDLEKTPVGGTWKVGGEKLEYNKVEEQYEWNVSPKLKVGAELSLSYTDRWGADTYYTARYGDLKVDYRWETEYPRITGVTPMVIVGNLICVCGYFPDEKSRNGILLDGKELGPPISASDNTLIFRLPEGTEPGVHTVSGSPTAGYGPDDNRDFEVIRVRGTIDRDKLMRGESTPLRMVVEGTEKVLNISLENETPEIITLEGGNKQVIATSGGANNGFEKTVQGHTPGDFVLNYELDLAFCPCSGEGRPEDPQYFENLYDETFHYFRRARDEANDASRNKYDNLELAKMRARESLETFTTAREKLEEGIRNGEIGPTTAATFRRFIEGYETQARDVLAIEEKEEVPIASRPENPPVEEPVTAIVTDGWLSPVQAVWQGDDHFDDAPTKQLTKTGPGQWNAELNMVVNKPTVIFGIRADGRNRIKMEGTTNGSRLVPVRFRFKLIQNGSEKVVYTQPSAENNVALDGPVGPVRPWATSIMASEGLPRFRHFLIDKAGSYTIEAELIREDGSETGLKIGVSGQAVRTFGPDVKIVPVILSSDNPTGWGSDLEKTAQTLATDSQENIPRYYPIAPGGMTIGAAPLENLRSIEPGTVRKIVSLLPFTDTSEEVRADALTAAMAQRFGTGAAMTNGPKVVALLSDNDFDLTRRGGTAQAYCVSTKFMVARHDSSQYTVAHELVHSMPYLWSRDQMVATFGKNYHNKADNDYGNGAYVSNRGAFLRKNLSAIMSTGGIRWITQATYWHLLTQFNQKPDPELLLVRGFVAREGAKRAGFFLPSYRLEGIGDLEAARTIPTDQWYISVKDQAGTELAKYPLYTRWRVADLDVERKVLPFTHRIPWTPDVRSVHLMSPSGEVARQNISANRPSVAITSPANGSAVTLTDGKLRLSWRGSDPDGDSLLYSVFYSPDDGGKWRLLSMDKPETSAEISLPGNPKKIRFRVVATDGARSGSDEISLTIN